MNDTLGQVEMGLASVANTQVSNLVGKRVEADTKSVFVADSGAASVPYTLDGRAEKVVITMRDADGAVVRRQELGSTFPGSRTFTWDGLDNNGDRVPVGRYTIEVAAENATGGAVGASTRVAGNVTSIDYSKGYPELVIGEARVMLGDVTSIGQ
jgi:flagellar basal-body rod modification protein FlgD